MPMLRPRNLAKLLCIVNQTERALSLIQQIFHSDDQHTRILALIFYLIPKEISNWLPVRMLAQKQHQFRCYCCNIDLC